MTDLASAPAALNASSADVDRRRRWPKHAAYGLAGLAVLLPTSTAGAGWYFATRVIDASKPREYPVEIRGFRADLVTLNRTTETERPVPVALCWQGGHAMLDNLVEIGRDTVVRRVSAVTQGELRIGARAYTSSFLFGGDPTSARGLKFSDVVVSGELGALPAWVVPPTAGAPASSTWVVAIHGRGGTRREALRVLPTIAQSGMTTLVVTYRNDEDAPRSPDRYYHLGQSEWRDVAAAVAYARAHGAKDVILYGWSMGGATALNALRWLDPGVVRGVVLDCPVVDWTATLHMNARQRGVPAALAWAAVRLVERRLGFRLHELDQRRYIGSLRAPVLAFVDADDDAADPGPTRDYARLRPDLVTLVETQRAGHTRSWNLDPAAYEARLAEFLGRVRSNAPETH